MIKLVVADLDKLPTIEMDDEEVLAEKFADQNKKIFSEHEK